MAENAPDPSAHVSKGPARPVFPVSLSLPDAGWIDLRLPDLLTDPWFIRCSYIFDSLPDLIEWLEAICNGARHAVWEADEEGTTALLVFHRDRDAGRLIHCCAGEAVYAVHAMAVDPRALVEGFWSAFRRMVTDPDYSPREWEMPESLPAITFDMNDPRWTDEVEAAWSACESAHPYGGAILRFIESETIEAFLAIGRQD